MSTDTNSFFYGINKHSIYSKKGNEFCYTSPGGNICLAKPLFILAVAALMLVAPLSEAATTPLPTRPTVNISDLVLINLNPGPNAITFYGDESWYPKDSGKPELLDYSKTYQTPGHLHVNVFDAQKVWRDIKIDSYFVTTNWISKTYLVPLIYPGDIPGGSDPNIYWIDNQITGVAGADQTPMFFQGYLNGKRQTFLIIATRQYPKTPSGELPTVFPGDPLPTVISIYKFYVGIHLSEYEPNLDDDPSFLKIDQFSTVTKYCSADDAIVFELQPVFAPATAKMFANVLRDDSKACTGDPYDEEPSHNN